MWNPSTFEKRLFGKLVLVFEDEILNKTEASLVDKKVICEKNNCLIYTISLIIICILLLVVISIVVVITIMQNIG